MYMNPDCFLCFSAMFLCASQLHHLVLLSIVSVCFSALFRVLPSIFAFFLPALIALLLGLNR